MTRQLIIHSQEATTELTVVSNVAASFVINVNETVNNTFSWNVRCYDNASNSAFNNTNFSVRVDTASPQSFSLLTPANNTITKNLSPIFDWADAVEGNFRNYTLQVSNGSSFETLNYTAAAGGIVANSSSNLSENLSTNANWFWHVIAYDLAGNNVTSHYFVYTTDTLIPSATILNVTPNPAEIGSENVTVNWTAGDLHLNLSIANVTYPNGSLLGSYSTNFSLSSSNLTYIGNYTITLFANDTAGNFNLTSAYLIVRDTIPPSSFDLTTPADGTRSSNLTPTLDWQDTVEADLRNYSIELSTTSTFGFINRSLKVAANVSNSSIIATPSLDVGINWSWRVIAYDMSNNSRFSTHAFRYETFENNPPTVPNNTVPSNDSFIIFNNFNFTWSASIDPDGDNLTYELLVSKDTAFTSIDANATSIRSNHFDLAGNLINLSSGRRYWKTRAYDGTNYSNYSTAYDLRVIVAIMNFTLPIENLKLYSGNTTQINVIELNGTDWIQNITVEFNSTNYSASNTGTNWSLNITFSSLRSRYMNLTAYGYNLTNNLTAIARRNILFSKAASNPRIEYVCSNETYTFNNTNITIRLKASLDAVVNYSNITLTDPSNVFNTLNATLVREEFGDSDLVYTYNTTYTINQTGNYTINATILDIEGRYFNTSSTIYANTLAKIVNLSGINVTSIKLKDICSNDVISNGSSLMVTVPDDSLFNIEVITGKPTLLFHNINLTNTTMLINYTDLERNISAPSGKRIVTEFEINANLTAYSNVTITYNYSSLESGLDDETNLVMYKCSSVSSCGSSSWTQLTTELNTTRNIISATISSFSVFLVAETATTTTTTTTTVTQTVTSSGGGGGGSGGGSLVNVPQVVKLELVLPKPLSMYLNDTLTAPIIIMNTGEVEISNISLEGIIDSQYMSLSIEQTKFDKLGVNESAATNAFFKSFAEKAGRTEAAFTAIGKSPSVKASSKLYIELLDKQKENKTEVKDKIVFLADLFKNNPECLELNELLNQAQEAADKGQFEKAKSLTESAINSCRELLSFKGKQIVLEKPKKEVRFKVSIPLIIVLALIALALLLYLSRNVKFKRPSISFRFSKLKPSFRFMKMIKGKRKIGPTKSEEEEINRMLRGKV